METSEVYLDQNLKLSGVLTNGAAISDTFVYLAFYDAFIPPRLIGVASIPIGEVHQMKKLILNSMEKLIKEQPVSLWLPNQNVFYS